MSEGGRFPNCIPPGDAQVLWVETPDDAIHILDGIFAATDGLVNVRREYIGGGDSKLFKMYVAPGALEEVRALLRGIGRYVPVGEIRTEP
ncbi:MAG: hypothetical protein R6U88_05135 [Candidatus Bipolaricaulota bacterium]